jgi:hypothetical protein
MNVLNFYVTFDTEGLGDRFILVSTILNIMNKFNRDAVVHFIEDSLIITSKVNYDAVELVNRKDNVTGLGLSTNIDNVEHVSDIHPHKDNWYHKFFKKLKGIFLNIFSSCDGIDGFTFRKISKKKLYEDFYEIVDFFHFKRPKNKITTNILKNKIFTQSTYQGPGFLWGSWMKSSVRKNVFLQAYRKVWKEGSYWSIDFSPKEKEKNVCYMLYRSGEQQSEYKNISEQENLKIKTLMKTFPEITFFSLEHNNYSKNVEILSKSHFIFATEGMWTHLSRAMNINTVAYSKDSVTAQEINDQGHYSSLSFDECLKKIKSLLMDIK